MFKAIIIHWNCIEMSAVYLFPTYACSTESEQSQQGR